MTTKNTFQITAWKWTKKTWLPNNCPDNRMKMNKINITIKLNYYSDHRIKFTTKKWLPNYSSDNRIQINKINMTSTKEKQNTGKSTIYSRNSAYVPK